MKATLLDLRRNPGKILAAIERNETVTISKRGKEIATVTPKSMENVPLKIEDSPAFGMWKDREDLADPSAYVRRIRKGRYGDL